MKKVLALTLALLMLAMSLVACGNTGDANESTPAETPAASEPNATEPEATEPEATEPEASETEPTETEPTETEPVVELPYASAFELINHIYTTYNATATEDTMLYVAGGNINNFETVSYEGPAAFVALADSDYNDNLGIPEAEAANIESAASMFNMMNVNVFNSYTLQLKEGVDLNATVNAIKDNILARQWICGAPEKLVIVEYPGNYIMVVWGAVEFGGIVNPYVEGAVASVEGATIVVEHTFEY